MLSDFEEGTSRSQFVGRVREWTVGQEILTFARRLIFRSYADHLRPKD